jgi:hypothetical protein
MPSLIPPGGAYRNHSRTNNQGESYALVARALGNASNSDQSVQSATVYSYAYSNESRATVP